MFCPPLQIFCGTIDGLFISFNVVTVKGRIEFCEKGMDYDAFTRVARAQSALKRTPGAAAGGKDKMITPAVAIISP